MVLSISCNCEHVNGGRRNPLNTFISGPKLRKRYVDDTVVLLKQYKITDSVAFLDTLITRVEHGQVSTKVHRKLTHTGKYLDFRSEHSLAQCTICAVLNTLLQRVDKLCNQESERQEQIDFVRSTLKQNGYPNRLLHRKKPVNKTKNEEHERRGWAILPYLPGLTKSNDVDMQQNTSRIKTGEKAGQPFNSYQRPREYEDLTKRCLFHAVTATSDTLKKPKQT